MRELSEQDTILLERWCANLPLEEAAYNILPEEQLELATEQDAEAVQKGEEAGCTPVDTQFVFQVEVPVSTIFQHAHKIFERTVVLCL